MKFCITIALGIVLCVSGADALAENETAQLIDRQAIEDVIAQYAYRWDRKDASGFSELFTEDTVVERWLLGERQSRLEGRDALLAYAKSSHLGRLADRQTRHHMSNIVFINLSNLDAVTENMVLITHQSANDRAPQVVSSGIYRIDWQKSSQGWRTSKRILYVDRIANEND